MTLPSLIAHEQVADRELGPGIGQRAARPEQLGERRGKPRALRPPCAVDQERTFGFFERLDQRAKLGTRHPQA